MLPRPRSARIRFHPRERWRFFTTGAAPSQSPTVTTAVTGPLAASNDDDAVLTVQFPGAAATQARAVVPVKPERIIDTRDGTGGRSTPLGPGDVMTKMIVGLGACRKPRRGRLKLTVTAPTASSWITVWPNREVQDQRLESHHGRQPDRRQPRAR